jgi:hypothetical protein
MMNLTCAEQAEGAQGDAPTVAAGRQQIRKEIGQRRNSGDEDNYSVVGFGKPTVVDSKDLLELPIGLVCRSNSKSRR